MTIWLRLHLGSGEGSGTPLHYSCLENPMGGGAWWAAVHGVTKSRTQLSDFTFTHWRRKWQPTLVFLPGESQGWRTLVGCHLWGRTESDTTEVTWQLNTLCPWQAHKESAAATATEATDLLTISLHPSPLPNTHMGQEGMSNTRSHHHAQR